MVAGIHQLHYLPWLRYFEKIARSDVFIVLDNIQFNKNGWQNRNRIKTHRGPALLTVPIYQRQRQRLDEVRINNALPWRRKHWRSIEQSYAGAPHFGAYAAELNEFYEREWEYLNELNSAMLEWFLNVLGIETRVVYATELKVPGEGTERLANLIEAAGADSYYSGAYALDAYLDADILAQRGISLLLQEWSPPVYTQLHGEFVPDLSILDLLMNCGESAVNLLLKRSVPA